MDEAGASGETTTVDAAVVIVGTGADEEEEVVVVVVEAEEAVAAAPAPAHEERLGALFDESYNTKKRMIPGLPTLLYFRRDRWRVWAGRLGRCVRGRSRPDVN